MEIYTRVASVGVLSGYYASWSTSMPQIFYLTDVVAPTGGVFRRLDVEK